MKPHDPAAHERQAAEPQEAELRGLLAARERRDEVAAPGYAELLRRPARPAREALSPGERWNLALARFAAAGALLALLALAALWRSHPGAAPSRPLPAPLQPALETWKAPTDFLLAVPGRALLDSTPAFPDSDLPSPPSGT